MSERRRALTAAFVAAAVLVAAVTAIVVVGRSSPPPLPTLAEQPEPRVGGAGAYLAANDDGGGSCVVAVDLADGSEQTRACTDAVLHTAAVTDDGVVTAVGAHPGAQLVVTVGADGAVDERIVDGDDVPEVADRLTRQPAARGDGARVTTATATTPRW